MIGAPVRAELTRDDLVFERPDGLAARRPPEQRGLRRDEVRLLVSTPDGHTHARFDALDRFLAPGDVLVVNASATLPASLPAEGRDVGPFVLNLSTRFGGGLWLAEPRWSADRPGPLPLAPGESVRVAGRPTTMIAPSPGQPRLWFVRLAAADEVLACCGRPIGYGYLERPYDLDDHQTAFARVPGSAEMPSAGRPFTARVLERLAARDVTLAEVVLHTGVSSLEVETEHVADHRPPPEPFAVPPATADAVNAARAAGRRVIAVGTTVVRALESAVEAAPVGHSARHVPRLAGNRSVKGALGPHQPFTGNNVAQPFRRPSRLQPPSRATARVRPLRGFSRLLVHPGRGVHVVDGLLTGLHDPVTSHIALLYALAGQSLVRAAYAEAVRAGYLWHEFGDSHLLLPPRRQLAP